MKIIIQRVSKAEVKVDNKSTGKISKGLLVLVGFTENDNQKIYQWITNKLLNLRIFPDENQVMNLSVSDLKYELLIVSNFTLYADSKKGFRPSYVKASKPDLALKQYNDFVSYLKSETELNIKEGLFGADMQVEIVNDGPVTIEISKEN